MTVRRSLLAGTDSGLVPLGDHTGRGWAGLLTSGAEASISVLVPDGQAWWAIADGRSILRAAEPSPEARRWHEEAAMTGARATCLAPTATGVLIGTSEAHLLRLSGGILEHVEAFDRAEGRDTWHTPWGGPPDTRSLSVGADGTVYANVHVGGVLRSPDAGTTWQPTMDIDADVHQVLAHPHRPGLVFAASARGLGVSQDGAASWAFNTDGLHASYCRAVAVSDHTVLVSASTGPQGERAAVYRRLLDDDGPFEKCAGGLPEWFGGNINTFCLIGSGAAAAAGTARGDVFISVNEGRTWERIAAGLAPVQCMAFV